MSAVPLNDPCSAIWIARLTIVASTRPSTTSVSQSSISTPLSLMLGPTMSREPATSSARWEVSAAATGAGPDGGRPPGRKPAGGNARFRSPESTIPAAVPSGRTGVCVSHGYSLGRGLACDIHEPCHLSPFAQKASIHAGFRRARPGSRRAGSRPAPTGAVPSACKDLIARALGLSPREDGCQPSPHPTR